MSRLRRGLRIAFGLCAAPALAHGVHQQHGTLIVLPERIVTTIDVEPDREAALLDELVLRDADGRRLDGRVVAATPAPDGTHVTCHLEHRLELPLRWLALQLQPGTEATGLARRLTLNVAAPGDPELRVAHLTSGGNVELFRFGSAPAEKGCGVHVLEDLHDPRAVLRLADPLVLDVVLPLGVLESFLPLPRADPAFLSIAEQEAARAAVLDLVRARVALVIDGQVRAMETGDVAFLGPDDADGAQPAAARRLGAWTARARISLGFENQGMASHGALRWDLFNGLVLRARVAIVDGSDCAEHEITSYRPTLEWERP